MPCKLARSWSRAFTSAFALSASFGILSFLWISPAHALLVSSANGGQPTGIGQATGTTVYYVAKPNPNTVAAATNGQNLFYDPAHTAVNDPNQPNVGAPFDLTVSQDVASIDVSGHRPNMLIFSVTSSVALPAVAPPTMPISRAVIMVNVTPLNNTGTVPTRGVPIVAAGTLNPPSDCAYSGFCQAQGLPYGNYTGGVNIPGGSPFANPTNTHFFAVNYVPNQAIYIGIYPADLCKDVNNQGGATTSGCGATAGGQTTPAGTVAPVVPGPGGTAPTMTLTFAIYPVADTINPPTVGATALDSAAINLIFQADPPTITCPTSLAGAYFPGDGSITLHTGLFAGAFGTAGFPYNGGLPASGRAPVFQLWTFGNLNKAPDVSSEANWVANNGIRQNTAVGGDAGITGFANSGTGVTNNYDLSFAVEDSAGQIAVPLDGQCRLDGVQTTAIQGILNHSRCFIATAAFRSGEEAPVRMLREFRDRVLLHSWPGRFFVHWYYAWSPPAAEWLFEHPLFRFPVLLLLVPVEMIAWLWIHPALAMLVLESALGLIFLTLLFRAGSRFRGRAE